MKTLPIAAALLVAQSVVQAAHGAPPDRIDFTIAQPCAPTGDTDEILVCGNRNSESAYRLKRPMQEERSALPRAQVQISESVSAGVEAEQVEVGGYPSQRAMVRFKFKF